MVKVLSRDGIQRMITTKGGGSSNSSGGASMAGVATQYWVEENYLTKAFFNKLFTVNAVQTIDGVATDITIVPNDIDTFDSEDVTSISLQSMFGFWTELYVSALGSGASSGGEVVLRQPLSAINAANLGAPTAGEQCAIVWDGSAWTYGSTGGIDWSLLAAATTEQINVSHLTDALSGAFTVLTNDNNQLSMTVGGTNKKLTVAYATNAGNAASLGGLTAANYLTTTAAANTYLSKTDASSTYVSISFFNRLFRAYNGSTQVSPNDTTTTIDNIKAMFGFWTEAYVSALGKGTSGSDITLNQPLLGINNANLGTPSSSNVAIVWDGSQWTYTAIGAGMYLSLDGGSMNNTNLVTNLNADLLDGHHDGDLSARYISVKTLTSSDTLDDISDGFYHYINGNYPTNYIGSNSALIQIRSRIHDRFQLAFAGNSNGNIYYRSSHYKTISTWEWDDWKTIITSDNIGNQSVADADTVDGIHASGLFTTFANDSNQLSITIGGTNKKLTVAYATNAAQLGGIAASSYLTATAAASTYLSKTDAASTYLSKTDAASTYVSIEFFNRLFSAYNGNTLVRPNDLTTDIDNIKAMFGFWTEAYISALGKGTSGSDITLNQPLSSINSAGLGNPSTANVAIVWDGSQWTYSAIGSGMYLSLDGGSMNNTNLVTNLNADLLDGHHDGDLSARYISVETLTSSDTLDDISDGFYHYINGNYPTNYIGSNSALIQIKSRIYDRFQLAFAGNSNGNIYYRSSHYKTLSTWEWDDWKTIITSDNIGNQTVSNATTATKLQTARTIWGQSFDGSGNIDGHLYLTGAVANSSTANTSQIVFGTASNNHVVISSNTDAIIINPTTSTTTNQTQIGCGTKDTFFNSSVGIGTTSPVTALDVIGTIAVRASASASSLRLSTYTITGNPFISVFDTGLEKELELLQYRTSNQEVVLSCFNNTHVTTVCGTNFRVLTGIPNTNGIISTYTEAMRVLKSGTTYLGSAITTYTQEVQAIIAGYRLYVDGEAYVNGNITIPSDKLINGTAANADMLDNYHASGLLTSFTSSHGTKLSISVGGNTITPNTVYADYADYLYNEPSLWGRTFDGWNGVSGDMTSVGDMSFTHTETTFTPGNGYTDPGVGLNFDFKFGGTLAATGLYSKNYVTALSDERKKDIQEYIEDLSVELIAAAPMIRFTWKDERKQYDGLHVGSIAQYWQPILPEAIIEHADGTLSMDYAVIALLSSIATARRVMNLEERVRELESSLKMS